MKSKSYSKGGGKYRKKTMSEKQVEQLVEKKMSQKSETKLIANRYGDGPPIFHNSAIRQGDCNRIISSLPKGDKDGERIGNEVTCQTLTIKGWVQMYYSPSYQRSRIGVRLFVFSVKGFANGGHAISNSTSWIRGFLRLGSTVKPFDGSVGDWLLPVNRDLITVHAERKMYLNQPRIYVTGINPPAENIPIQQEFSSKAFSINVKCRNKVLKFSQEYAGDTTVDIDIPQNYGPLLAIGYCHLDGSSPDVLDTAISLSYVSTLKYEDN